MTEQEFAATLWPIVAEASGRPVPPEEDLDVDFGDIDLDSLTQAEIFSLLEERLQVRLSNAELLSVRTPRGLLDLLNRAGARSG